MSGAELAVLVALAAARLWACLRVQASWRFVLGPSWEWIAAALSLVLGILVVVGDPLGAAAASGRLAGPMAVVLALGFEVVLGSVVGLAASLPGWALVGAAQASASELQLRGAASASLARVVVVASLAGGLALGLHGPLLAALLGLFERFALAQPGAWRPGLGSAPVWLGERAAMLGALSLALATPVLLCAALSRVVSAALGRGRSEAEPLIAALEPGLRLSAALLALGAAWSCFPEAFARGL